ncbi:uracil phosphoribosyltransferase [Aeoliella mucimassa]|uniref:Uracil phosphoribosyltransferase n=1 Tax=Aeoliella mucimassa TaxID=2527972 RepID=A0A518ALQ7_9BACT|nr:uracil phosphoribosyltransferase [Aeoliella mucimassa]QDU55649.1 Uracil phosphoribosyltransferase [Aeoliella mucimassa]
MLSKSPEITAGVFEVDHPLIECHLSALRSVNTTPLSFRSHVRRLATLLAYEATRDLAVEPTPVTTPLAETEGGKLTNRIGLIPILRAGLGMVDPVLDLIPTAEVWHLGLYRDEDTAQPVEYYSKLPPGRPVDVALVVDPMLATGGSMLAALETLEKWGVKQLKLLSIIASAEGIEIVEKAYPQAQIYVCKIDPVLNDVKYIVPGLGDAGDRIFNTLG